MRDQMTSNREAESAANEHWLQRLLACVKFNRRRNKRHTESVVCKPH